MAQVVVKVVVSKMALKVRITEPYLSRSEITKHRRGRSGEPLPALPTEPVYIYLLRAVNHGAGGFCGGWWNSGRNRERVQTERAAKALIIYSTDAH